MLRNAVRKKSLISVNFATKNITFFFNSTQTCAAQIRAACVWQIQCEHISLLLWSDQTRFITFIWFRRRFVHFSPEIVTEQIPIFRQLDLLGARFGSVGSPVTQGDHSTMPGTQFLLYKYKHGYRHKIQVRVHTQIFVWLGKHCHPRRAFNNVAGQTFLLCVGKPWL